MKKSKRKSLKVKWIDKHTMVFEWKRDLTVPWNSQVYGTKKELVISQEGKDLYFLMNNGGRSDLDFLWFFCEFGLSLDLIGSYDLQSCLLGKDCGWVMFCRDFKPGTPFGEDKDQDLGERLITAEKISRKIVWQECNYCEHWNKDNVVRIIDGGKERPIKDNDLFITNENVSDLIIDEKSAFCNLLAGLPDLGFGKTCKNFTISKKKDVKSSYEKTKSQFKNYIDSLKVQD